MQKWYGHQARYGASARRGSIPNRAEKAPSHSGLARGGAAEVSIRQRGSMWAVWAVSLLRLLLIHGRKMKSRFRDRQLFALAVVLTSVLLCYPRKGVAGPATTQALPKVVLPKVVLLGDSIRQGYAPIVSELLAGRAIVVTPSSNGWDTVRLLKNLDEWAIREQPDVVHFNCGIHDTKRSKATDQNQVSPEQYEANLREIVQRLRKETKAKVVFALSTPIMDDRAKEAWTTRNYRVPNASITEYNGIAG